MTGPAAREEPVRLPAVAGSFYSRDPVALGRQVDAFLAAVGPRDRRPLGLIVPHAGLVYSGAVAAAAWATLRADPPATIVIAGTNHFVADLAGVAIWPGGSWVTPLGDVTVDADVASRVGGLGAPFAMDPWAHLREHSIEVQLPFVARACPAARLVPLLVSCRTTGACVTAGERLGRLLGDMVREGGSLVLVASSDFAHYPDAAGARRVNRELLPAILDLDPEAVADREAKLRHAGMPGLACGLCGLDPVLFSLAAFRAMGAVSGALLSEATSADVPGGDPFRTVGYAAIAFDA